MGRDLETPWDQACKHQIFIGRKFSRNLGRDFEGIQTIITAKRENGSPFPGLPFECELQEEY